MRKECDCGSQMTGKWADQHTIGCASLQPSPMTADEIVNLIRETYDPIPADWPRHRGWDDGADEIADKILESFGQKKPANPSKLFDKCPLCGLTPERGLHRFCTRGECPVR